MSRKLEYRISEFEKWIVIGEKKFVRRLFIGVLTVVMRVWWRFIYELNRRGELPPSTNISVLCVYGVCKRSR